MRTKTMLSLLVMPIYALATLVDIPLTIMDNLPPYVRDRGNAAGCIRHPLSQKGMNTFMPKHLSMNNALPAYYSALAYLRYTFQKEIAQGETVKDCGTSLLERTSFDRIPKNDFLIAGVKLSEMNVIASAFEVRNRVTTNVLSCVLLSFRKNSQYLFSVYYIENNGHAHLSFPEAAENFDLLGEESYCPFLTETEYKKQVELLAVYNKKRFRWRFPEPITPNKCTNDVEVIVIDL